MTIYDDYFLETVKYKKVYGPKTLVLMQVGSFYEIYALKDSAGDVHFSCIKDVCKICGFRMSLGRDSKLSTETYKIINPDNVPGPFVITMAGCPVPQFDKYITLLKDNGYTIPLFVQDANNKNTTRSLNCIYSAGTMIDSGENTLSNNIMCVWISQYKERCHPKSDMIVVGISIVNSSTGSSSIYEFTTEYLDFPTTYDDLERFNSIYNPCETLIIGNLSAHDLNKILTYSNIVSKVIHIKPVGECIDESIEKCEKQTFQDEIIGKIYEYRHKEETLDILTHHPIAFQSFCYLLDFLMKHNTNLVKNINVPHYEEDSEKLILANHTLKQLNIINDGNHCGNASSICDLLNRCSTKMGRRKMNEVIMRPITNIDKLAKEYSITEHVLSNMGELSFIKTKLECIGDVEYQYRKIINNKLSVKDVTDLYDNIITAQTLFHDLKREPLHDCIVSHVFGDIEYDSFVTNTEVVVNYIKEVINFEKIAEYDSDIILNYINKGFRVDLDDRERIFIESNDKMICILNFLNKTLKEKEKTKASTKDPIKMHITGGLDVSFECTRKRGSVLKLYLSQLSSQRELTYISSYDNHEKSFTLSLDLITFINSGKDKTHITSSEISTISSEYSTARHILHTLIGQVFNQFVDELKKFNSQFFNIVKVITNMDITYTKAFVAKKYNYAKPNIVNKNDGKSYVEISKMRHALIEHIQKNDKYVPNDINIGMGEKGILLYGTNAVGKTSLIRSIGISVILAQSGFFVPCESMTFYPFQKIFTRIIGNDNLFKGLSTFAVEIIELRNIINNANENSLILGDELCSGTETESAISIFIAGIEHFTKIEASFIFATHMHEIVDKEEVTSLNNVVFKHMKVHYDNEKKVLVYDRLLQEGSGERMYGLEVCKALNMKQDFLERAHELRRKFFPVERTISETKQSRYNRDKLVGMCEICNKRDAVDTHHLEYQAEADNNGYLPDGGHKNHLSNLCAVCKICHDKIHAENLVLTRKLTTDGPMIFTREH